MNKVQRIVVGLFASIAFAAALYFLITSKFCSMHFRGIVQKALNNSWGYVCFCHFQLALMVGYYGPINFHRIPPHIRLPLQFTIESIQGFLEILLIVKIGEQLPYSGSNVDWRLMLSSALFAFYCIFFSLIAQHHVRFSMALAFTKLGLHMAFGYELHRKKAIAFWGMLFVVVLMVSIWHEHRAQVAVLDVPPEVDAAENESDDSDPDYEEEEEDDDPDYEPGEEEEEEAEEEDEEQAEEEEEEESEVELVEEDNEFQIVERHQNQNQPYNGEWMIQIGEILQEVPAPQLAAIAAGILNHLADWAVQHRIGN